MRVGVAAPPPARKRRSADRVLPDQAAIERVLEHGVQEREHVPDRLGREPGLEHRGGRGLDVGGGELGDRRGAQPRGEVDAAWTRIPRGRSAGRLARQAAAAASRSPRRATGRLRRGPVGARSPRPPEACGRRVRPASGRARRFPRGTYGADQPIQEAAVEGAPAPVVRPVLLTQVTGPTTALSPSSRYISRAPTRRPGSTQRASSSGKGRRARARRAVPDAGPPAGLRGRGLRRRPRRFGRCERPSRRPGSEQRTDHARWRHRRAASRSTASPPRRRACRRRPVIRGRQPPVAIEPLRRRLEHLLL